MGQKPNEHFGEKWDEKNEKVKKQI